MRISASILFVNKKACLIAYNALKGCGDVKQTKVGSALTALLSGLFVVAALVLLLCVCGYCYPSVQDTFKEMLAGAKGGAVQQAFDVLADGLQSGESVRETFSETIEVLFYEKG